MTKRSAKISGRVSQFCSCRPLKKNIEPLYSVWADNGDAIARAYGGSDALKSDFTRTNNRTYKGALEDGYKSIMRYLKNNYFDGARQVMALASFLFQEGVTLSLGRF